MRVILLGTGGPRPDPNRAGPAVALQVDDDCLLFDAGRGASLQLVRAGIAPQSLHSIFITHHHFDHIGDLGDVILASWNNGGDRPPAIFGPKGTRRIVATLLNEVYGHDIDTRLAETAQANATPRDIRTSVKAQDVQAGLVFDSGRWRVRAEHVDHMHGLGISREDWVCLGYRVEAHGKVVAISGDTVDCAGLQRLAQDADVLVQCCYLARAEITDAGGELIARHILASSAEVGKIAARAGVKTLVLTHFREKSETMLRSVEADVRRDFPGDLVLGRDLLTLDV